MDALGERREDSKDQATVGRRGVIFGASEHAQAVTAAVQLLDRRHKMFQAASQAAQLSDDESVARLQGLQEGLQAGSVVMACRGAVFVNALRGNTGVEQDGRSRR